MTSVFETALDAVVDIPSNACIAVGGFGLGGSPLNLVNALERLPVRDLRLISCGTRCIHPLVEANKVKRVILSWLGENMLFTRLHIEGKLEIEVCPMGTLIERLRAGGSGIGAFYTPTGVGTFLEDGGMPVKYSSDGTIIERSPPKETRLINGMEGRSMDLVASGTRIVVAMEHSTKEGAKRILSECSYPVTGRRCVDRIITDLAVFDVDREGGGGLTLMEIADGMTLDRVRSETGCEFNVSPSLCTMPYIVKMD